MQICASLSNTPGQLLAQIELLCTSIVQAGGMAAASEILVTDCKRITVLVVFLAWPMNCCCIFINSSFVSAAALG